MVEKNKKVSDKKELKSSKKTAEKRTPKIEEKQGKLTEAAKNIEDGIELAGEKFSEIAEKTSEAASELYKVLKNKISSTYESGAKIVDDINKTAQNYIEKYKQNAEIKRLTDDREQLTQRLGAEYFSKIKTAKDKDPISILKDDVFQELINEIEKLEKEIIKIGKKLEKK
jgi:hypothetical protein